MEAFRSQLTSILQRSREELVRQATDIAFVTGEAPMPRPDVEQMMRACVALIEEGLAGESQTIRTGFLEAMPDVARASTLRSTLKNGLPTWGVLVGMLSAEVPAEHREDAIRWLSRFMGEWWADVVEAMLPVIIEQKTV
jgi:hypothetical protein